MGKLTWRAVKAAKTPGTYGDGDGLYLQVKPAGRSWILRYQIAGRRREMGLGSLDAVSLADARDAASDARRLVARGVDPIEARKAAEAAVAAAKAGAMPFRRVAEAYIKTASPRWKATVETSEAAVWRQSFERHVYPIIGTKAVSEVGTADIVKVLEPIWRTRHVTATRLRQRLEQIVDYAMTSGHRPDGLNCARWKGHLKHLLPVVNGNGPVHRAALPWREMPALVRELAGIETVPAMALRWTVLTVARTIETRRAQWVHVDTDAAVWTCPPAAMKAGRPHLVPLSRQALAIVQRMDELRLGAALFPGARQASKLSASAMLECLQALRPGVTVHGLRAAFRTWVADTRRQDRDLAEHALAHVVEGATELAYQRSDHLEPRRELMQAWGDFCCPDG